MDSNSYGANLRRVQRGLLAALGANEETKWITAEAEQWLLALLALTSGTDGLAEQEVAELVSLRDAWFAARPWYHRVVMDVVVATAARGRLPAEFYANLWVGNSSVRDWIIEAAWIARDRLDPYTAVCELLRNVEFWQLGAGPALLRWVGDRHRAEMLRAIHGYQPRHSFASYQAGLVRFFAEKDDDGLDALEQVERSALSLAHGS